MAATWKLEFPYRRSVGPVIGEFLAGLRDRRVLGVRTEAGRVLVPPLEYDPESGEATVGTVEVGQSGVVQHSAWVADPLRHHPLDRPFAWALVQLDGADTALLHALDAGSPEAAAPGTRVRIRWAHEPEGKITDIVCFERADGDGSKGAVDAAAAPTSTEPMQFMSQMTAVEYQLPEASLLARRISEAIVEGRIIGHKCPECGRVYVPPRGYCPLCSIPTGAADERDIEPRGTITTFSVITPLQYQGQEEKDDYVQATILLDGSTSTIGMQRVEGAIAEVHTGMRVEATWREQSERALSGGSGGRNLALGEAISGWKPTGEPDAPLEQYADYIV